MGVFFAFNFRLGCNRASGVYNFLPLGARAICNIYICIHMGFLVICYGNIYLARLGAVTDVYVCVLCVCGCVSDCSSECVGFARL